jgi:CRP/FNR family transcriptional regulator, nitrogen oxide reductase regulator
VSREKVQINTVSAFCAVLSPRISRTHDSRALDVAILAAEGSCATHAIRRPPIVAGAASPRTISLAREWSPRQRAALLATAPLFADLPPVTRDALATALKPRRVRQHSYLFQAGETATAFHVLAEGQLAIVRETDEGQEVILRLIGPGEIFGGVVSWGAPTYPASARAVAEAVVLQLPATAMHRLLADYPALAIALLKEIASRLREAEARILDLQTKRVERRIARILLGLAEKTGKQTPDGIALGVRLSRQDLAALAGTTIGTASRTLAAWDQQGLIMAGRTRVTIRVPHALVAIAEELPSSTAPGAGNQ